MKYIIHLFTGVLAIFLINACGPSEEELQREEQARQDSLEQAREQQREEIRQDSLEKARADSIEQAQEEEQEEEEEAIVFDEDGNFSLQVESWRSEDRAEQNVSAWKERGFDNAYVVKYGDEERGDVWFRVRLGRAADREAAEKAGELLADEYNVDYWISNADEEPKVDE